jgi:aspartate aminotransferase-like enzyme
MPGLLNHVDPEGHLEYSVVYSDRALNHMSESFQSVMNDLSASLRHVYNADPVAIVPGSGTFGMEAVARQFAHDKNCLILRNGWFSYRWSQILEMGQIPKETTVLKARRLADSEVSPFTPAPIEEVITAIKAAKPDLVFAPHVETSSGMMLPTDYLKKVADAVHAVGGMFVLDCIASGTVWVDMAATGVDILLSAPQKGWSAEPCCGLVMMSPLAAQRLEQTTSSSFACDLKKWRQIMQAYEQGGHAYHATMPTEGLRRFRDVTEEIKEIGLDRICELQMELGRRVRKVLADHGFISVAADGFEAPGVVVCYTDNPQIKSGKAFLEHGIQIAAGVPLQCDEPEGFQTFRVGLFGIDKLLNLDRTEKSFAAVVKQL